MKTIKIFPIKKPIRAILEIPGSKSYTNRALLIGALCKKAVKILNPLYSEDTEAMLSCLEGLGINIMKDKSGILVKGSVEDVIDGKYKLNAKYSGTTIRFILALSCLLPGVKILTGEEGLNKRPVKDLVDVLRKMGAKIEYLEKEGFPPLKILSSKLNSGEYLVNGSVSSQFLSAVLMIAPVVGDVKFKMQRDLISKPYVDMTLDVMQKFGVRVENENYQDFSIKAVQKYKGLEYFVEGDFSSAGYFFAIAALTNSVIKIKNLSKDSKQADKNFLEILKKMGNIIMYEKDQIVIEGKGVKAVDVNMEDCPDQIQTLAVLAAFAKGVTKISGIKSLRVKETDRVEALKNELSKMGIKVNVFENEMEIYGGSPNSAAIDTYGDHRMAMAFSVAGTKLDEGIVINVPDVVKKTFPEFWKKMESVGIEVLNSRVLQDDRSMYKRIFVTGFRATGKSTFSKLLSQKLGWKLVEMDDLIVKKAGMGVYEMTKGRSDWSLFRKLEHQVLKELVDRENMVISTGGGLAANDVLSPHKHQSYGELNYKILDTLEDSLVVLLDASEKVIAKRIKQRELSREFSRPVLNKENAKKLENLDKNSPDYKEKILKILVEDSLDAYRKRKQLYEKLAEIKIDTGGQSIQESLNEIMEFLKGKNYV